MGSTWYLGPTFVTIYQHLYEERKKHPKGSPENAMLKLALNGCYGDSNNPYSVFYDSLFTMKVTLSGQMFYLHASGQADHCSNGVDHHDQYRWS